MNIEYIFLVNAQILNRFNMKHRGNKKPVKRFDSIPPPVAIPLIEIP